MTPHRIGAMAALLVTGCKMSTVEPTAPVPANVDAHVVMYDGTTFEMTRARELRGNVCGSPHACVGPSCDVVLRESCVSREDVAVLRTRVVDGEAVGLGVGLAAVAVVGAVLVASANKAPSSSSGGGGGGTYTSSSSGCGSGSTSSSDCGGPRMGSCPRAYSWDGASFRLDSGTYGLSFFEAAQRTDFDRLDFLAADHGKYRLRLANEERETEHTDLVRLHVVDHPQGTRIVPVSSGKILTFRDEVFPSSAVDLRGRDAKDLVAAKDDREWTSDLHGRSADRAEDARDGLRLSFAKPKGAKVAKLRVAAHNTAWAGQMLAYMLSQRGRTLPAWFRKINEDPKAHAELVEFLVREGMLNVRVKTPSGWSTRGVFWAAGREIVKEEAFEIAVSDVPGDALEIELESALDFWSVDAVSVAYGADERIVDRTVSPATARASDGRDITAALAGVDAVRYDTKTGDTAELVFDAPSDPAPGWSRSFVLETSGYYVPEITPAALPNPAAMDALMATPLAASRLALVFRLAEP